ncbi:hypothetical protein AB0M29_35085 [Streptomyces sp. NPDC051976]|uniref:hypothetical protein n=1 Tax=Streptomyces sp. NPDC051976 TaxID=3154947 RepID=UPI00342F887D
MTIADPAWARARVCCAQWQELYESAFAQMEDTLSAARVRLLAAQHAHDLGRTAAVVARWRTLLEEQIQDLPGHFPRAPAAGCPADCANTLCDGAGSATGATNTTVTSTASAAAARQCAEALESATAGLPPEAAADCWYWTPANAESVLVDAGAGVVAHRLGVRAQVCRRPGEAADWWRCAAASRHPSAVFELAVRARACNHRGEAHRWWERAAADGAGPPFSVAPDVLRLP